ncbi:MAG: homogentisate 1,2-dioxygenase [Phycisphaerales bacterium]|nr:homogentisate 1,2-dioxygenase [Phycisphaerales bacterium]
MIQRHQLGNVPPKPHTAFYGSDEKLLMEQCVTRRGFEGPFSVLYFKIPPTDEFAVDSMNIPGFCPIELVEHQPLHRRHVRTQDIEPGGDFLTGRHTLMVNADIHIGLCKPTQPPKHFFSNGDGDECYFINSGSGFVESLYGILPFREHDYLLIPKSTPYRIHFEGNQGTMLIFEGRGGAVGIPKEFRNEWGQITMYAPYTHRDFRLPERLLTYDKQLHGDPPYLQVTKLGDELSTHKYDHWPYELEGWDGFVYPVAFNIHDYQPKAGLVHLPPTTHITFSGPNFVICSFVPRMVDFHEKAIPCPYGHASVDMDEILYYVAGNFTSRKGIDSESISLHPQAIPHGPHPGTYERSIGVKKTSELAVMMDCYKPLRLTKFASGIEQKDYHLTWVK